MSLHCTIIPRAVRGQMLFQLCAFTRFKDIFIPFTDSWTRCRTYGRLAALVVSFLQNCVIFVVELVQNVTCKKTLPYFFDEMLQLLLISLLVLCGILGQLLFEDNISFFGKPGDINYGWIRYVWVRWWRLLDNVSSTRNLSVLLSAVGMTCTTQAVIVLVWLPLLESIHTRLRVLCLLVMATIWGRHLFRSRALGYAATIWAQPLFEGSIYLKKYSIYCTEDFDIVIQGCTSCKKVQTPARRYNFFQDCLLNLQK